MKRYYIEDVRCDVVGAGMDACVVIGGVKYRSSDENGDKERWLYLEEIEGTFTEFYETEEDIFDDLCRDNIPQEEFEACRENNRIGEIDGIELPTEYEELFENFREHEDSPALPLLRYLILVVRCDMEELAPTIAMGRGRYIDEVQVPKSDLEEEEEEEEEEE